MPIYSIMFQSLCQYPFPSSLHKNDKKTCKTCRTNLACHFHTNKIEAPRCSLAAGRVKKALRLFLGNSTVPFNTSNDQPQQRASGSGKPQHRSPGVTGWRQFNAILSGNSLLVKHQIFARIAIIPRLPAGAGRRRRAPRKHKRGESAALGRKGDVVAFNPVVYKRDGTIPGSRRSPRQRSSPYPALQSAAAHR